MLEWEQIMEIKILRRQGKSLRQIAREAGVSVNTVVKYLKHEGSVHYKPRASRITNNLLTVLINRKLLKRQGKEIHLNFSLSH